MNGKGLTKKLGLVGSGAGVAMFLLFGLLQGALIGGTVGLEAGGYLGGDLVPRVLAGAGMVLGALLSGVMFVTAGLAVGRLTGYIFSHIHVTKKGAQLARAAHN